MKTSTNLPAAALLTALAASAPAAAAQATSPPAPANAELEAIYRARLDSAKTRFTTADVEFMTGMIAHHAQALVMAGLAPAAGAGNAVRTLAARIINAQSDEIATMQAWLRDRGQPAPEVHLEGTAVRLHGAGDHAHPMPMAGMLTDAQMAELAAARGADFDRLFLTYMIQHHRGAVAMVEALFRQDGAGQDEAVFKFASDVQVDQITEIGRMESMLAALPGAGRAP